jgi:Tfp pilus assembly protein PilO
VSRRNTMLLAVVATVAAAAAYWMLLLAPKREEAAKLATSITTKQGELQAAQLQLATYERAKVGYKANYSLVARLGKAVPADDDVRSLMIQLNSAAGKSKVDFRTIEVGGGAGGAAPAPEAPATGDPAAAVAPPGSTPVGSAGFAQMPFTFSFKGSYFNLGDFFRRVDRLVAVKQKRLDVTGRLMVLSRISLTPDATGFPRIRASIGATTYLLPATQGLTAGAGPEGPGTAAGTTPAAPGATATPAAAPSTTTAAIGATP